MKRTSLIFFLLISAASSSFSEKDTTGAKSVYKITPWVDGPVLGVAALGASVPLFFQDQISKEKCPCDRGEVNRFDRPVIKMHSNAAAWASHLIVGGAIAAPIYLDYKEVGWSKTLAEDFTVYAQVLSINTSLSNLARYTTQRPRPSAYRETPPPGDSGSYLSFYSGHTATTVGALAAASMTYHYRYGPHVWPWVVTGVVGATDGALRSAAGKHFFTDSLVGLVIGTGVGIAVPMMHHRQKGPSTVMMVPVDRGAVVTWQKTF